LEEIKMEIQIFVGEKETFLKTVSKFETVAEVVDFIKSNLKFEVAIDFIDETAGYVFAMVWDFRKLEMIEKQIYFITEAYIRRG